MQYIGKMGENDPLYSYLRDEIFPQIDCRISGELTVYSSHSSNEVYIYEDEKSGKRVVGKFFYSPGKGNWEHSAKQLEREYNNTRLFRSYLGEYHYAARVLGRRDEMNCLLLVEYCYGEPLDAIILRAIQQEREDELFEKLKALAWFLAEVHNRSAEKDVKVDFNMIHAYFCLLAESNSHQMSPGEKEELYRLAETWRTSPIMGEDNTVLVHGDATPSNFFFGDGMHVITFDLERVRRSDRLFDVGRLCGELQHFFLRSTGNKYKAEPFIGHFLWEYACHFPDRERTFEVLSGKIPFYMGKTLLRIARNSYLDNAYRRKLVEEAFLCLRRTPE